MCHLHEKDMGRGTFLMTYGKKVDFVYIIKQGTAKVTALFHLIILACIQDGAGRGYRQLLGKRTDPTGQLIPQKPQKKTFKNNSC